MRRLLCGLCGSAVNHMAFDINNFLISLACAIGEGAGLAVSPTPPAKRSLWVHEAIEAGSTATYTVLRIYGGIDEPAFSGMRQRRLLIQADTRGKASGEVQSQARAVYETLFDEEGRQRMAWEIPGKVLADGSNGPVGTIIDDEEGSWIVPLVTIRTPPGIIGEDEQGRKMATSNFDVQVKRVELTE